MVRDSQQTSISDGMDSTMHHSYQHHRVRCTIIYYHVRAIVRSEMKRSIPSSKCHSVSVNVSLQLIVHILCLWFVCITNHFHMYGVQTTHCAIRIGCATIPLPEMAFMIASQPQPKPRACHHQSHHEHYSTSPTSSWLQVGSRFRLCTSVMIALLAMILLFDGTHHVSAIHLSAGLTLKGAQGSRSWRRLINDAISSYTLIKYVTWFTS